jgi:alkylation response protein AidB-like acyl-CoA dehydrogenase
LLVEVMGPLAQPFQPIDAAGFDYLTARFLPRYFNYRKTTIYAGSNEIQRNIIAKMSLGL